MIKAKRILFIITGVLSLLYYVVCIIFAGPLLSFVWIWLLLAGFCFLRAHMLTRKMQGREKWHAPKWLVNLYRVCLVLGIGLFAFVEAQVVAGMSTLPQEDLEYIIVLGAGVNGTTPTRPLKLRIQTAYEYMEANPDTMLIASGGKGWDERISEAECIRNSLVEMGLDESRIIIEDASRDTEENIRNSYEFIPSKDCRVGVVTNSFHVWRSLQIAKSQGCENISGVPAKTLMPVGIHYVVREFFGYVKWKFL